VSLFDNTRPTSAEVDSDMCNLATGEVVPIPTSPFKYISSRLKSPPISGVADAALLI